MIGMFFGTLFFAALLVGLGVLVGFLIPSGESTGKYHDGFLDLETFNKAPGVVRGPWDRADAQC